MNRKEIDKKFEDIVDFADIGEFLDSPVSTYSSGMTVRLGFSIAIHSNIDILLADEILAVGDINFQKKCFEKIIDLRRQGISTVFVSHSIAQLERLCTKGLLINNGNQIYCGNIREAVKSYMDILNIDNKEKAQLKRSKALKYNVGVGNFKASNVKVYQSETKNKDNNDVEFGKNFIIEFDYEFEEKLTSEYQLRVTLRTFEGHDIQKFILQERPFNDNTVYSNESFKEMPKKGRATLEITNPKLFPQTFVIDIALISVQQGVHEGGIANAAEVRIIEPLEPKLYFEYGNMTITQFDYEFKIKEA